MDRARQRSTVASFANGIAKDEATVRAAIISPWSNGQTEDQTSNVRPRQNRSASSLVDWRRVVGAAPNLRQSPSPTPIDSHEYLQSAPRRGTSANQQPLVLAVFIILQSTWSACF